MDIWSLIFILALLVLLLLCICECTEMEHDAKRIVGILVCIALLIIVVRRPPAPIVRNPLHVYFWNRSGRSYKRGPWQVTNYRKPHSNLPAADYLMGVELAKTDACSWFNLEHNSDIDRLKRCFYFFPDIEVEYKQKYELTTGICVA